MMSEQCLGLAMNSNLIDVTLAGLVYCRVIAPLFGTLAFDGQNCPSPMALQLSIQMFNSVIRISLADAGGASAIALAAVATAIVAQNAVFIPRPSLGVVSYDASDRG